MSHYTALQTRISDLDLLIEALADLGFDHPDVFETAQPLLGWRGDERQQTAELIIRRRHLGAASNDIGFGRTADGFFEALISDYDRRRYDADWIGKLSQRYAYRKARRVLASQGFDLVEENMDADRRIHMTVRRTA